MSLDSASAAQAAPQASQSLPGSSSPPLQLEGVAHRFGRRWILRGVDLTVNAGEVVAVVGANGAGKTTLLRIAGTLLRPSRGRGRVGGADLVEEAGEVRGMVGLLGHSPALYEDLTPRENLRFSLRMRGLDGDGPEVAAILNEVGLSPHGDTPVRRFSAGMRRRVAVGRVLASLPHLLLMDEPYASLDPAGVELVNRMIGRVRDAGGGVLLATHDLHSGAGLTDRVLILDRGLLHRRRDDPVRSTSGQRAGEAEG